jgi:hypothetical protein
MNKFCLVLANAAVGHGNSDLQNLHMPASTDHFYRQRDSAKTYDNNVADWDYSENLSRYHNLFSTLYFQHYRRF